jgi:hypothetical protein
MEIKKKNHLAIDHVLRPLQLNQPLPKLNTQFPQSIAISLDVIGSRLVTFKFHNQ